MKLNSPRRAWSLAVLLASVVHSQAYAAIVVAVPHQETVTPINGELGSILQLPSPVKTVTPSRYFKIRDVANAPDGSRTDVRTFHVTPVGGARPEPVTFVLASGKALALKLIPTPGADKFLNIEFDASVKKGRESGFLAPEMQMMRAMLLGETGGYSAEISDQKIDSPFEALHLTLSRVYAAEGFTGYVFRVQNKTPSSISLHLSSLGLGEPNRAVLSQADRWELVPCALLAKVPECETTLRLVVRGGKEPAPMLLQKAMNAPPFVRRNEELQRAGDAS